MERSTSLKCMKFLQGRRACFLPVVWITGLVTGVCFAYTHYASFSSLMRMAVLQPVSIVGLLVCVFLPLVISLVSIALGKPVILLILCFIKAVCFGFSGMLIALSFHSAGWLIKFLLLFSDSCYLILLFWLWLRHFDDCKHRFGQDFYICLLAGMLIAGIDYFVISPILQGLF